MRNVTYPAGTVSAVLVNLKSDSVYRDQRPRGVASPREHAATTANNSVAPTRMLVAGAPPTPRPPLMIHSSESASCRSA